MCRARRCAAALATALWAGAGCAYNTAPPGFLPSPSGARHDPFGAWIEIIREPTPEGWVAGELIAVSDDTIWVRVLPDTLRAVPTSAVTRGQVVAYASQHGRLAIATLIGTVSTVSNGYFLIFTAPGWILVGTAMAASQSRRPVHRLPPDDWTELAPFARFPQGMPPGLDRGSIFELSRPSAGPGLPRGGTRELRSAPGPWLWVTGTVALGAGAKGPVASIVGVNVGRGPVSVRTRYVAWGSVLARPSSSEVGLLLGFRPPRPRWAYTYELGLGLGQQQYRSYYPGDDIDPSYGLAFSAALAWPSPGPLGLKAEAFGNLLGATPFVGLGVSLELGWRPVLP